MISILSVILIYISLIFIVQIYKFIHSWFYVYKNKHYFITGGSVGLGQSLAKYIVLKGGKVTIVARHLDQLNEAKTKILDFSKENSVKNPQICVLTCDVTDEQSVRDTVQKSKEELGQIDVFISCAGYAETGYMFGMGLDLFHKMMNVNYFGCLNMLYEIVPDMMTRNNGEIYIVSSAAGLTTYIGYGAYSPSKYALKGLSDGLRNELSRHHIHVGTIYPPNMNTPGFQNENKSKPAEGRFIERFFETCYEPDYCAKKILHSIEQGNSHIYCGAFDNYCLSLLNSGMGPRNNFFIDALLFPIVSPILLIAYYIFNWILYLPTWKQYEQLWYPKSKYQ